MVYHDCQICYGKYGYAAEAAGEYVAHHVLAARPLYYHSFPDHLYWTRPHALYGIWLHGAAGKPSDPRACFLRTDNGWAEGLHPVDAFLKNTHEVLGPLHAATAHQRLTRLEFLTPDGMLRRAVYGEGQGATTVVVNFGAADRTADFPQGASALLPAWGFVVQAPRLTAFYSKRFGGRDYPQGALFAVQAVEGNAARIRIFHGFGDAKIDWRGVTYEVRREKIVAVGQ